MKPDPVVHFEMPYENPQRVSDFYEKVFGWNMNQLGSDMGDYILAGAAEVDENQMIKEPGKINGGFFPKTSGSPQYPSVVIQVNDLKESMRKIREAGGKINGEAVDISGIGQYISFTDTEGNQLSILEPPAEKK